MKEVDRYSYQENRLTADGHGRRVKWRNPTARSCWMQWCAPKILVFLLQLPEHCFDCLFFLQMVSTDALLKEFSKVQESHATQDAKSYNDDVVYKERLNEVIAVSSSSF